MQSNAVIVAMARTPIGRAFKGSLAQERPEQLGVHAINAAVAQVPGLEPNQIDELIVGCGVPGGMQGWNLARVMAVELGWDEVAALTVTRFCASSLEALRLAAWSCTMDESAVYVVAGVESISSQRITDVDNLPQARSPRFAAAQARTLARSEDHAPWEDPRHTGELPDVYIGMGETAENLAQIYGITREEQDAYALLSQQRTTAAAAAGHLSHDIAPYPLPDGSWLEADESPRPTSTAAGLAELKPVFREQGTVTAGNACPLNDGAAALVVMSQAQAHQRGLTPLARIRATTNAGVSPEIMGMGPVPAVKKLLQRQQLQTSDIDAIELNEAFAVQVLANCRHLNWDPTHVNEFGGSIALGHPYGMTGARMVMQLIRVLEAKGGKLGLATMCAAGGQGSALLLERLENSH